ncbi:MAG: alkaline phosphatase PhoX [Gemmatimonadota bacterium]
MREVSRRGFLLSAAALGGAVAPSLRGLMAYGATAQPEKAERPWVMAGEGGYGPLYRAGPELALPEGFQYVRLGVEGTVMSDGVPTPRAHDGMAAFRLPNGNVRLIRNHEDRDAPANARLRGPATTAYDLRGGGGTTSLEIAVPESGPPELIRDFVSLNGTIFNCAGGPTPWGTWLSCEEITEGVERGWNRPHGYVFEVAADAEGPVACEPLRAMGRFTHEAVAVDPDSGILYLTEDRLTAGFYRFVPETSGRLVEGGRLQMLGIRDSPHYITSNGQRIGRTLPVAWIDIAEPDPPQAEENPLAVFAQGYGRGGALFSRLEGCWYGDGSIYFDATNGGNAEAGQIWQYRPSAGGDGELTLLFESPSVDILNSPDNLTVSPRGGLVICEDTDGAFVRGLTPTGKIFDFARNLLNDREFAGACFSPDGRVLFFNIQGDTAAGGPGDLGMTFAVWGPWEAGAL